MKRTLISVFICLVLCFSASSATRPGRAPAEGAPLASPDFGKVPLYFIANQGQADGEALFYAKTPAYTLWLTRGGLQFDAARMAFRGARPEVVPEAVDPADYVVSYFDGRDESDWRLGIPTSKAVLYKGLYEGIDLKVYGTEKAVEYDWIVAPGADPGRIRFGYEGGAAARLNGDGDLVIETADGALRHRAPKAFQIIDGAKVEVASSFRPDGDGAFGFALGPYDRGRELVIDPLVLVFSTYLGGTTNDMATGIGVDAAGAVYVSGYTDSLDFPPYKANFPRRDAFITKFSPDGQSLVYSAFFPIGNYFSVASSGAQAALSTAPESAKGRKRDGVIIVLFWGDSQVFSVDASGAAYLAGTTSNNDFPVKNAYQPAYGGGAFDGFFLKLAPNGKSLVFSSYYGGSASEMITALAVDATGAIYLGGNFLVGRVWWWWGRTVPFIAKIEAGGKTLAYKKVVSASGYTNQITGIAVDAAGAVYAAGITNSLDLPVKDAFQKKLNNWVDGFVFKVDPAGKDIVYCSYLGGPNLDLAMDIAVDGAGAAYVVGFSQGTIPVKNAFRAERKGAEEGFLCKVAPDGRSLVYSTYLGGVGVDIPYSVILDAAGSVYVVGQSGSIAGFPLKDPYKSVMTGYCDGFLTVFRPSGRSLEFSTFFGGSGSEIITGVALDAEGAIYLTGHTNGNDFPVLNPYQAGFKGGYTDSFVTKLKR